MLPGLDSPPLKKELRDLIRRSGFQEGFQSGTRLTFNQSTAPVGWTKDVTQNDKALRIVSGAVSTGGSVPFSTAFSSRAVAGTIGGTTLTTGQLAAHGHDQRVISSSAAGSSLAAYGGTGLSAPLNTNIAFTGNNETHTHSFSGTAINMAVNYVDVILAQKD